jgi:hypothetical protein
MKIGKKLYGIKGSRDELQAGKPYSRLSRSIFLQQKLPRKESKLQQPATGSFC